MLQLVPVAWIIYVLITTKIRSSPSMKTPWLLSCSNRITSVPHRKNMNLLLWIVSAWCTGMTVVGLIWGVRLTMPIPVATIANENQLAYRTILSGPGSWLFENPGDNPQKPYRSTAKLFENNQRLGPAHSLREAISSEGQGRFSHWRSRLYFSTSDNSDPCTNGRFYKVVARVKLPAWMWGVLGSCFVIPLYLSRASRPHIGLWSVLQPIFMANAGAKTVEPGHALPRERSRSMGWVTWIIATSILSGLCQVIVFVSSNYRTAPPPWDFLLLIGQASLHCIWLVGLITTCAFVWQAGRHIGVLS